MFYWPKASKSRSHLTFFDIRWVERDGNDSHHPPRGPRCLLCLGRATARPVAARQVHCRRRRGGAGRFLRSQSVRGLQRHVGLPGARALSATYFCRRPFWRLPAARRCGHRRSQRFHPAGRAHFHRRSFCRCCRLHPSVRLARRDSARDPAPGAERTWPADLDRRCAHQAPGQNCLASPTVR